MAQQTAFKKKKSVEVIWRRYTDVVEPTGPEFDTKQLRDRLISAMRNILMIHELPNFPKQEEEVFQALLKKQNETEPPLTAKGKKRRKT